MKFSIHKKLRLGLISFLIIGVAGVSFLLYRAIKDPGYEEEKVPLFSYNNKATADFTVYFKPNELYDTKSLSEDRIYITEFIDHIEARFNYEFSGDKAKDLKGTYHIIAKVQGYTTDRDENIMSIWEKDFILRPNKSFTIAGESKSIKEDVNINIGEYNEFASKILEASKISCQTSLTIIMNIKVEGETRVGRIEETISPSLMIPLNSSMIQIRGNRTIDQPGAIEETREVQLPVNKNKLIILGAIIGVALLGIVFLVFFTEGTSEDPYKKELRRLFKKHGDRFVALNNEISASHDDLYSVKSMDDLVRIADEIGRPILYKYSYDYRDINRFYVIGQDEIYVLDFGIMEFAEKSI